MGGIDFDLRPLLWLVLVFGVVVGSCAGLSGYYVAKHLDVDVGWRAEAGRAGR